MQNARLSTSMFPCWNFARITRVAVASIILILGINSRAEAGIKSQRQLASILMHTPAPLLVTEGEQFKLAEKMAAQIKNAIALMGVGQSMEPLYAANTAVVVAPIHYDHIKKGMTVVYVKSNGRRVAHSIIGETRGGYLVQGVNNDKADAEVVNESNLIGVIVQAYASSTTSLRAGFAQKLANQGSTLTASKDNT